MGSGEEVAQEPGRPENDPQAQHEEPLPEAEQASTQSKKEERPRKKSQQLVEDPDHVSDSDDDEEEEQHCGSRFALRKENKLRTFWESLILVLVAYTGTIFIYRLCFIGFRVYPPDFEPDEEKDDSGWTGFDTFVTVAFWFDLFSGFFLTFSKENGDEVDDLRHIAKHYLSTDFFVNLIACVPEDLVSLMIPSADPSDDGGTWTQTARSARLQQLRIQRMSRLTRLVTRFGRLAKLKAPKQSPFWKWLMRQKGLRVVNLTCGLTWIVHILACGWYLCASLHAQAEDTWVMRRVVDGVHGTTLAEREPGDQWLHAMYFVLTVFTTVGFGDMSAFTSGEIIYVCFLMGIGAVVHSIIMGEVINTVTSGDKINEFVSQHRALVEAFAAHTELDEVAESKLRRWVDLNARAWFSNSYDREGMKALIIGEGIPRGLLDRLPHNLFSGMLHRNRFLKICAGVCSTPPRLPLLLALSIERSSFMEDEIVYLAQDYPFCMFLVVKGTFAYVSKVRDSEQPAGAAPAPEPAPGSPGGSQPALADQAAPSSPGGAQLAIAAPGADSPVAAVPEARHPLFGSLSLVPSGAVSLGDCSEAVGAEASVQSQSSAVEEIATETFIAPRMSTQLTTVHSGLVAFGIAGGDQAGAEPSVPSDLFPYMLFSAGSYFGESELVAGKMPRRTTARCEIAGDCLRLTREDFNRVSNEFPQFGNSWAKRAMRQEKIRVVKEARLTEGRQSRHLAAAVLQEWFRTRRERKARTAVARVRSHPAGKPPTTDGHAAGRGGRKAPQPLDGDGESRRERDDPELHHDVDRISNELQDVSQRVDRVLQWITSVAPPPKGHAAEQ